MRHGEDVSTGNRSLLYLTGRTVGGFRARFNQGAAWKTDFAKRRHTQAAPSADAGCAAGGREECLIRQFLVVPRASICLGFMGIFAALFVVKVPLFIATADAASALKFIFRTEALL